MSHVVPSLIFSPTPLEFIVRNKYTVNCFTRLRALYRYDFGYSPQEERLHTFCPNTLQLRLCIYGPYGQQPREGNLLRQRFLMLGLGAATYCGHTIFGPQPRNYTD